MSRQIIPCRSPWKGVMTGRERFRNQMHYKPFDRTFNMEFGYWKENFSLWPIFVQNGVTNNPEAEIFFNFDVIKQVEGEVLFYPHFVPTVVRETPTTCIMIDKEGLEVEVPRDGHDTIPHVIKPLVTTPEDWKRVKEERLSRHHPGRKVNVEAFCKAHPEGRDYPLGVNCGSMIGKIRNILTMEGLAYAVYDHPDMVEDMVETCCLLVEDFLDQVLPHFQCDFASNWEDISCKSGPLVNVDFFKNVVVPRYKRISSKLHAAGVDIWYSDCDGDVRPLLPHFLEGGINCLFPYEVNSCAHPAEVLKEYGQELRIMGGVDKIELGKGPVAIKKYLQTLVPLVERGGYIPFCDHRCPPNVKPEDYIYYLDLKEKMFGMK